MDVGFHHGCVHAHLTPAHNTSLLRYFYQPCLNLLDHLRPTAKPQRPIVLASGIFPAPTLVKSR
jgi:hypothetical protein